MNSALIVYSNAGGMNRCNNAKDNNTTVTVYMYGV